MAKILIIGASRGIGRAAAGEAIAGGHTVRAMSRDASAIARDHPGVEPFSGDATDPSAVAEALAGTDAVIQALGVAPGLRRTLGPVTLFSDATRTLVAAMAAGGPKRLVAVTGFGAGDSRAALSRLEALGHDLLLGRAYADKTRQEAIIAASGLDWTIVRPTILTGGRRTRRYRVFVEPKRWRNGMISRADVAHFLVSEIEAPTCLRRAPVLAY